MTPLLAGALMLPNVICNSGNDGPQRYSTRVDKRFDRPHSRSRSAESLAADSLAVDWPPNQYYRVTNFLWLYCHYAGLFVPVPVFRSKYLTLIPLVANITTGCGLFMF